MRNISKKTLGRGSEDQKGFTPIERFVVSIIVALAAVIVPLVIQFSGRGDTGAANAEWDSIQSAIDTMMADSFDFDAGSGTQNLSTYCPKAFRTSQQTQMATSRISRTNCAM